MEDERRKNGGIFLRISSTLFNYQSPTNFSTILPAVLLADFFTGTTQNITAQSPINFTIINDFQQLKKAGRSVSKGEHGFLILVPSKLKQADNSEMISEEENVYFFTATVFDISQTEVIAKSEAA